MEDAPSANLEHGITGALCFAENSESKLGLHIIEGTPNAVEQLLENISKDWLIKKMHIHKVIEIREPEFPPIKLVGMDEFGMTVVALRLNLNELQFDKSDRTIVHWKKRSYKEVKADIVASNASEKPQSIYNILCCTSN